MQAPHTPVLLNEVLSAFKDINEGVMIDATLGFGGHSEAILSAFKGVRLVACEQDSEALGFARGRLAKFADRAEFHHCNFAELFSRIDRREVVGVLADLGVSSWQLDSDKRGFSVNSSVLDMRMNAQSAVSAYDLVNFSPQSELERIFRNFGELKDAKNLAFKICEARKKGQISSGKALAAIIGAGRVSGRAVPKAILTFQALRIAVNDELGALKSLLNALECARPSGCVVAIISFHSLEDRLVKNAFKAWARACKCDEKALRCTCQKGQNLGKILTKKPLTPSAQELARNSRAACAKLRAFRFNEVR